jgi:DNA-binding MarR family transcriptional regulator
LPVSLRPAHRARLFTQGRLQTALHQPTLGAVDRRAAGADRSLDLLIADAVVGGQEDLRPLQPSCGAPAAAQEPAEFVTLCGRQINAIANIHEGLLVIRGPVESNYVGVDSALQKFTDKQGQYLAFIHAYSLALGRPPAEADIQRFLAVTPPTVHQVVLTLERKGFIGRKAGSPRSIRLLIDPEILPALQPVITTVQRY